MGESRTDSRYSLLAVTLHWVTFMLLLLIYPTIEIAGTLPLGSELADSLERWHVSLGLTLVPVVFMRWLVMRRAGQPAIFPPLSGWQVGLTRLVKRFLYLFLFVAPLSGWIFLSADGAVIGLGAFPVPAIAPESRGLADLAASTHFFAALAGYGLIMIHVLAALAQHYLVRNNTLQRMAPWIRKRQG